MNDDYVKDIMINGVSILDATDCDLHDGAMVVDDDELSFEEAIDCHMTNCDFIKFDDDEIPIDEVTPRYCNGTIE